MSVILPRADARSVSKLNISKPFLALQSGASFKLLDARRARIGAKLFNPCSAPDEHGITAVTAEISENGLDLCPSGQSYAPIW